MLKLNKSEKVFYEVLHDLKEYLDGLTLVGGWLPYIYVKYLWDAESINLVTTVDIDFGVANNIRGAHRHTIFERLSAMGYCERHLRIGHDYPVVFYKDKIVPIDFIASPDIGPKSIEKYLGTEIYLNKVDDFNILLNNCLVVNVDNAGEKYKLNCAKPSAYLYHKCKTFTQRDDADKLSKDLYYAYYILRYAPDILSIFKELGVYAKNDKQISELLSVLATYFQSKTGKGCLLVEKENGTDMYIDDIRQDIFDRFSYLIGHLKIVVSRQLSVVRSV